MRCVLWGRILFYSLDRSHMADIDLIDMIRKAFGEGGGPWVL